jgi:hypothetical protein
LRAEICFDHIFLYVGLSKKAPFQAAERSAFRKNALKEEAEGIKKHSSLLLKTVFGFVPEHGMETNIILTDASVCLSTLLLLLLSP